MKKNIKMAKRLLKLAKELVAATQDENFADSNFGKVMNMSDTDIIDGLLVFAQNWQIYINSLQQLNGRVTQFNAAIQSFSRRAQIDYYKDHPEFIKITSIMGEYGENQSGATESALRELEREMAKGTKIGGLILPTLSRVSRTAQLCVASLANKTQIAFMTNLVTALKNNNLGLFFRQTQNENRAEGDNLETYEYVRQKLTVNYPDFKLRLKGLNANIVAQENNIRMCIATLKELEEEGELKMIADQVLACSTISSIAQDQKHLKVRKELGLAEFPTAIPDVEMKKVKSQVQNDKSNAGIPDSPVPRSSIGLLDKNLNIIASTHHRSAGIISSVAEWFMEKASDVANGFKKACSIIGNFIKSLLGLNSRMDEVTKFNNELDQFIADLESAIEK